MVINFSFYITSVINNAYSLDVILYWCDNCFSLKMQENHISLDNYLFKSKTTIV